MTPSLSEKRRHRHSPEQVAALTQVFDRDQHPSLTERQALAEEIGMETKTVNSWFQNKRASQKKSRQADGSQSSAGRTKKARNTDGDDFSDDYIPSSRNQQSHMWDGADGFSDSALTGDATPRKIRTRPTVEQVEALRSVFAKNDHPSTAIRESLAIELGMSMQSVTNWFQNQRSQAKKAVTDAQSEVSRLYAAYPPPTNHPSLPPASNHPSLPQPLPSKSVRSVSHSPEPMIKPTTRRSSTPYSYPNYDPVFVDPQQLVALQMLWDRNSSPSSSELSSLTTETGLELSDIVNWFRNMRHTHRKTHDRDRDDSKVAHSPLSRAESPSYSSSSSRDGDGLERTPAANSSPSHAHDSDIASDDDQEEAVTPPPESVNGHSEEATPFPVSATVNDLYTGSLPHIPLEWVDNDPSAKADLQKRTPVEVEGALTLLTFHARGVEI